MHVLVKPMFLICRKLRQIAEAQTIVTNTIICSKCGGAGHIAKDCVQFTPAERVNNQLALRRGGGELSVGAPVRSNAKMDSEYMSLMAELGQVNIRVVFFLILGTMVYKLRQNYTTKCRLDADILYFVLSIVKTRSH